MSPGGSAPDTPSDRVESRYRGARVAVHYVIQMNDVGTISHIDRDWIELVKDGGDTLLIPIHAIRLIKLLSSPATAPASNLLRASASPDALPESVKPE